MKRFLCILSKSGKSKQNYMKYFKELNADFVEYGDHDVLKSIHGYDALILTGGKDISPERYGEINTYSEVDAERDDYEFHVLEEFVSRDKLVFGICRGLQVVNVYFGGTLYQDLPRQRKTYIHKAKDGDSYHQVAILRENPIFGNSTCFRVNSAHHQAVRKLGANLEVLAISPSDLVVEAIVHKQKPIYCVQWHPERIPHETSSRMILEFLKKHA